MFDVVYAMCYVRCVMCYVQCAMRDVCGCAMCVCVCVCGCVLFDV